MPGEKDSTLDTVAAKNKQNGIVVPKRPTSSQRFAARLVYILIRLVGGTIRFQLDDRSGLFKGRPRGQFIGAFWHNRLALSAVIYERYVRKYDPGRRMAGLVSASRDGALLAQIQEFFRIEPVRGSSSRRGPQALMEMVSRGERGFDLAFTPDGPRGPRCVVQDGVISAAQLTGLPIVPVSWKLNWKIQLKSWDGFQIPLPFARCAIVAAKPIVVPREASEEQREAFRVQLEQVLNEISAD